MCVVGLPSGVLLSDHLTSAAFAAAGAAERDGITFDEGAFVPCLPFRAFGNDAVPLSGGDAMMLDRTMSVVTLVRLEQGLVPLLGQGLLASTESEAAKLAGRFPHDAVLAATIASAQERFVWSPSQVHYIGLNRNMPGLLTTTVNERRQRRLGIHFDSWDQLPMPMRARSRYRLSINVGAGDRFFLFMAQSAATILDAIKDDMAERSTATDMLRLALHRNPHWPVYRLRVPPLWGYVAQTDYLPHDGSTFGAGLHDFSTHMLADFKPSKNYFRVMSLYGMPC
jgi:hypothetical protein